jgi:serine/threonine protein kinase
MGFSFSNMKRLLPLIAKIMPMSFVALAGSAAEAVIIDHKFVFTIGNSEGQLLAIPPKIHGIAVDNPNNLSPDGVNNPLYEEAEATVDNPLYESTADPGSVEGISSISFTLSTPKHLHREGIIHRDIAARNFQIQTSEGLFSSAQDVELLFGNDGPMDLRGVGPVRWMAPESLRFSTFIPNGSTTTPSTQYFELQEFSYFEASYFATPEPSSALGWLLTSLFLCLWRARRNGRLPFSGLLTRNDSP